MSERTNRHHARRNTARATTPYVALPYDAHAPDLARLESVIGYRFKHKDLLLRAMTHASMLGSEQGAVVKESNERLEFLGDRILSFLVDHYLFVNYPALMEGDLTILHSAVVANETLTEYAAALDLCAHLRYARGTHINGTKIPADTFEALLAAIYLDRGKLSNVEKLLLRFIPQKVEACRQELDWAHLVRDVEKNTKH